MSGTVVLVGASVRAMARSAIAAGWRVVGIDLFGDADLSSIAEAVHVVGFDEYPLGIEAHLRPYAGLPICYTGSLENNPELLECFEKRGPLWGNQANVVRRVRDIRQLHSVLTSHGFRVPRTIESVCDADQKSRWLVKSLRSAGGMQVSAWRGHEIGEHEYLQEEATGKSCSALFISKNGNARLCGVTRQILYRDLTSTPVPITERPFQYVGSIGPIKVETQQYLQLEKLGQLLASEFGLRGIFGVDWIDAQGDVLVIEVNPRYVASAEVIEAAIGKSLFHDHVTAFDESVRCSPTNLSLSGECPLRGKLVVFASDDGSVAGHAPCYRSTTTAVRYADIPTIGTLIPAGFPVLTLLANGDDERTLFANLEQAAQEFLQAFFIPSNQRGID